MATRHEAKVALWEASRKDDKARKFLSEWISANSEDAPGGYVDDSKLAAAVRAVKK